MAIKRGAPSHRRRNAKNFTHGQAQKRLDETVEAFNAQVDNSLQVNKVEIDYYQKTTIGRPCTCEKTMIVQEYSHTDNEGPGLDAPQIATQDNTNEGVRIRLKEDTLFGDSAEQDQFSDSADSVLDLIDAQEDDSANFHEGYERPEFEDNLLQGGNVDCGVCYRTGYQPGYKAYGKQRHVLTIYDVLENNGYYFNTGAQPHPIERQLDDGHITFEVPVPKYWKSMTYSIRDSRDIISGAKLYTENNAAINALSIAAATGGMLRFRIREDSFTHVSVEFDVGANKVVGNLGTENETLDYSRMETIGSLPVVLPPSVANVEVGDILVLKERRLVLKITDRERKITSDQRRLEWVTNARVLQPSEALKHIAIGTTIKRVK